MTTIDNTNILNIGNSCDCTAFVPTMTAVYAPTATIPNVIITESSTIPGGDNFKRVVATVSDKNGNRAYGAIHNTGSGATFGTVTISGGVTSVPVTAGGTLYCSGGNGRLLLTLTGGTGSGATVYANVVAGVITSTVITNAGSYSVAPTGVTVTIKSTVIPLTGLLTGAGIDINATVSTWGGAVNTSIDGCKSDIYMYGISAAGTYVIGDSLDERDNESVNDTE